jgi:aspartate/methionine/tyrosine aminotransferase
MPFKTFEMERMQSTWENLVEFDLSESGVRPVTLRALVEMGFDLEAALDTPLGYSQSDGTPELKELLCRLYPGAKPENIEVTNGTSEANFLIPMALVGRGDEIAMELPNYMQLWGIPSGFGAAVSPFRLDPERGWEPDWQSFEEAVTPKTKLVYLSNPNNPTGGVLSEEAMRRIVARCEQVGALLMSDEVYLGAEIERERTRSFWSLSDGVVVTSGLSKAYGIHGVRIGWIVGPPDLIRQCWTHHDYLTICPNKLSDMIARTAVKEENREKLYARTRRILRENLLIAREWIESFGGALTFREPEAGAIGLARYSADIPSLEISERIRRNRSTLIVPGSQLGLEGYLRLWIGGRPEFLREGLGRVGEELRQIL